VLTNLIIMSQNKKEILIATENRGKAQEIQEIFQGTDFVLRFLFEFRADFPDLLINENAKTFEGNALIKAIVVGDALQMITLGDDSGLCIDALGGLPGVYSARYAEEKNDAANIKKVLAEMKDIPFSGRDCHYHCTVAIYDPATKFVETVTGSWEAKIALEPRGDKSFGYAPIIMAKDFGFLKTNAEMDHQDLISVNHRGKAFKAAIGILNDYLK